ncbi:hypothetical protein F4779DRAFT_622095 [Xylariaceae sp. FL0662B]|nr:hypothetical protein F4779DRAFT_622095 [Xylariaceae sp. FL0662B]
MAIPLPLLWQAKLPITRKLILGVLFSSGIFIIIATLLRTFYSLRSLLDLLVATAWATREYLVTAFVVSAPAIKPLLSRRLWGLKSSTNRSGTGYGNHYGSHGSGLQSGKNSKANHSVMIASQNRGGAGPENSSSGKAFEMPSRGWPRKTKDQKIRLPSEASQEHIVQYSDEEAGIHVTESYTLVLQYLAYWRLGLFLTFNSEIVIRYSGIIPGSHAGSPILSFTDGLSVAASVIAVVDVSTKVASLYSQYYKDVKNAENDIA